MWHYNQCPPGLTPGLVPPPRPLNTGPGTCNSSSLASPAMESTTVGGLLPRPPVAPWKLRPLGLHCCTVAIMHLFFTSRGNFGADSNNFGPCPSHAFCLTELQSLTDLLLFSVLIGAASILIMVTNLQRFTPFSWRATPLQKRLAALQLVVLLVLAPGLRLPYSGVNQSPSPGRAKS